ncbi:hypothetical protein H4Q32_016588 [Labeo rohita]|uniref:Uncharacterized protein n=1 Tax=Labeo rohita TaxID=84645 RepID=A0ABQ8M6H8_LABRO|nr:hypothetical protein H4Q32_016588 [Labeo rohita]
MELSAIGEQVFAVESIIKKRVRKRGFYTMDLRSAHKDTEKSSAHLPLSLDPRFQPTGACIYRRLTHLKKKKKSSREASEEEWDRREEEDDDDDDDEGGYGRRGGGRRRRGGGHKTRRN